MVDTKSINTKLGACPECSQMNEDIIKLSTEALQTGLSGPIGVLNLVSQARNWPKCVLDENQIVSYTPLTVECKNCKNTYQP